MKISVRPGRKIATVGLYRIGIGRGGSVSGSVGWTYFGASYFKGNYFGAIYF